MTQTTNRRVLALAIDGANPLLLHQWATAGKLPNLERLLERGSWGVSRGLENFLVGSTWPSLYTGTSPAEHGHHSLVQLRSGTYDSIVMGEHGLVRRSPFWDALSNAGRRVAILDVPLSELSTQINGIQTVEWGSHDAVFGFRCSTDTLRREIVSNFGLHPLGPSCDGERRTARDYETFVTRLVEGIKRKGELTRALLRKEPWDFLIQVFTESHCAGHQCWHLHDVQHPAHDPSIVEVTGDPLERVYSAIDAAIGDIISAAGSDTTIAVFSPHGMSYWYGAQLLLAEILFRLGASERYATSENQNDVGLLASAAAWGWHKLPSALRRRMVPLRNRVFDAVHVPAPVSAVPRNVDVSNSRCFPVYNGLIEGGIRLNIQGREPNGRLAAEDVEAFCATLRNDLLTIKDQRTGDALIRDVIQTKNVLQGAALDALPDVLVLWSDAVPTGSLCVGDGRGATIRAHSPRIGTVSGTNDYCRTGEHRSDGFCVFAGKGVVASQLSPNFSIYDYAPTFAAMLGVNLPQVSGRPLTTIA